MDKDLLAIKAEIECHEIYLRKNLALPRLALPGRAQPCPASPRRAAQRKPQKIVKIH
jgi:hypothetical protein